MNRNATPAVEPDTHTDAPIFDGVLAEGLTAEQWREIAHRLWDILDDIDTLSDSMKPEQTAHYRAVMRHANKRHWHLTSDGYTLTLPDPDAARVGVDVEGTVYPQKQDGKLVRQELTRPAFTAGFHIGWSPNADMDKLQDEFQAWLESTWRSQQHER